MKALALPGGLGDRLSEAAHFKLKPMVDGGAGRSVRTSLIFLSPMESTSSRSVRPYGLSHQGIFANYFLNMKDLVVNLPAYSMELHCMKS
jgi:hypothetical protein